MWLISTVTGGAVVLRFVEDNWDEWRRAVLKGRAILSPDGYSGREKLSGRRSQRSHVHQVCSQRSGPVFRSSIRGTLDGPLYSGVTSQLKSVDGERVNVVNVFWKVFKDESKKGAWKDT